MENKTNELNLDDITSYMDELKKARAEQAFNLKLLDEEIKKTEIKLETILQMSGADEVIHGIYRFGYKTTTKTLFNQAEFKKDNPELFEKYKTEKTYKNFDFKING